MRPSLPADGPSRTWSLTMTMSKPASSASWAMRTMPRMSRGSVMVQFSVSTLTMRGGRDDRAVHSPSTSSCSRVTPCHQFADTSRKRLTGEVFCVTLCHRSAPHDPCSHARGGSMSQRENLPESDQKLGAPDPETPDTTLRRGTLGLLGIIFFVVAASAPLAGMTGAFPVAVGIGNGAGAAGMYVAVGIVLLLFSVGYATMSHYVTNTGAFFAYVGRGLGIVPGVGSAAVSVLALPRGAVGRHRLHRLPDEAPVRGQVRPGARVVDLRARHRDHRVRAVGALGRHRRQVPRRPPHASSSSR